MTARYVVGFMLDRHRDTVVLIQKRRPEWQAGMWNGIGGKIEGVETPREAMAREFEEEAGLATVPGDWHRMCTITWPDDAVRVGSADPSAVHFLRSTYGGPGRLRDAVRSCTDERVALAEVMEIHEWTVVPNLRWLIPLAAYTADHYQPFTVQATVAEVL